MSHQSNSGEQVKTLPAITYAAVTKGYAVRVGGKTVGHIRMAAKAGFRYFPLGVKKSGGATFSTLEQCKKSLEAA